MLYKSENRKSANFHEKSENCKEEKYVFADLRNIWGNFKSKKSLGPHIAFSQFTYLQITKKVGLQIENTKVPHLRKVRKSNKLFKSGNLRICDYGELADRPLLEINKVGG